MELHGTPVRRVIEKTLGPVLSLWGLNKGLAVSSFQGGLVLKDLLSQHVATEGSCVDGRAC